MMNTNFSSSSPATYDISRPVHSFTIYYYFISTHVYNSYIILECLFGAGPGINLATFCNNISNNQIKFNRSILFLL